MSYPNLGPPPQHMDPKKLQKQILTTEERVIFK